MFVYSDFEHEVALPFGFARGFGEAWRIAEDAFRRGRALGFGGGRAAHSAGIEGPIYGLVHQVVEIWRQRQGGGGDGALRGFGQGG